MSARRSKLSGSSRRSSPSGRSGPSRRSRPSASKSARRSPYHHGDLRRALVGQALETIRDEGVNALTLRGVGEKLGVSRSALYRHFADKAALLEAVATDGFRQFRMDLQAAWDAAGGGPAGLAGMGVAYVRFALANPSHYRVMFGRALRRDFADPDLRREGDAAFHVLFDAIVSLQESGQVRRDDPHLMSRYVWSVVHGIAMLSLDVPPRDSVLDPERFARYGVQTLIHGLALN